jgi:RNA polymerase sigma-70 factor (ECF subfamily)
MTVDEQQSGIWQQIAAERPFLLRIARLQLSSSADAEDLVQETLAAAVQGWASFQGRSGLRSWLTGILRHKLVDAIRQRGVQPWQASGDDGFDLERLFTDEDAWHPDTFVDHVCAETLAARRQLLDIVEICMNRMPEEAARLFLMREYLGMELADIEACAAVSAGNLRVMLYRTRMRLRECTVRAWGEPE